MLWRSEGRKQAWKAACSMADVGQAKITPSSLSAIGHPPMDAHGYASIGPACSTYVDGFRWSICWACLTEYDLLMQKALAFNTDRSTILGRYSACRLL
jgi:hypothetical protein